MSQNNVVTRRISLMGFLHSFEQGDEIFMGCRDNNVYILLRICEEMNAGKLSEARDIGWQRIHTRQTMPDIQSNRRWPCNTYGRVLASRFLLLGFTSRFLARSESKTEKRELIK